MSSRKIVAVFIVVCAGLILSITPAQAQKQDPRWFGPFQLSSNEGVVGGAPAIAADPYGFVHTFWVETGYEGRYILQYARFDGTTWSVPIDIFISPVGATFGFLYKPLITMDGTLHLFWTLSSEGPLVHLSAPATDALTARNWTRYPAFQASAFLGAAQEDASGVIHVIYGDTFGSSPGLYYMRSFDGGRNFSSAVWIDPGIPSNYAPSTLHFQIDPSNGIFHLMWRYEEKLGLSVLEGREHRYMRSLDGGNTWTDQFSLDIADEEDAELRGDALIFAAKGDMLLATWAGTTQTNREYAYSTDAGVTWRGPLRAFGDLHGSANGDAISVDAGGDFHFMAQIRYPQGLYDIVWDGTRWGLPGLIYLISTTADDPIGDRIHVHNVRATVRLGNQLVTVFTDTPSDPTMALYAIHRTLEGVAQTEKLPTPMPTVTPTPFATHTPAVPPSSPTPTFEPFSTLSPRVESNPGTDLGLSLAAGISVIGVVVLIRILAANRVRKR